MRNLLLYGSIITISLLIGCTGNSKKVTLDDGFKSLELKQYPQAVAQADAYLQQSPEGPEAAKAMYLRGRAFEERTAASPAESLANLNTARRCYVQALTLMPSKPLEGYIRTNLAKVEFYQEDYRAAVVEFNSAYENLKDDNLKGSVLYYIGVCQQRLGRFAAADEYFTAVQRNHPGTPFAQAAQKHIGCRQFYVQLATFTAASNADRVAADLRRQGIGPVRLSDSTGRQIIRVGPYPTYEQARSSKSRFAVQYPDAIVVP